MYHWRSSVGPLDLAFTDHEGGARKGETLADFTRGAAHVAVHQVHGSQVLDAREVATAQPRCADCGQAQADGLVSAEADVTLTIKIADCLPLLLADAERGVIGAAHVGRKGLASGVAAATVARMRDLGAGPIEAWIGPRICGSCYEVPADMRAEVEALVPGSGATTSWGTPSIDIAAGLTGQLAALGVAVADVGACTRESPALDSYRRDGRDSGRMLALIRRRGDAA